MDEHKHVTISASEISEYLYCHRSWWYHRQEFGIDSLNVIAMNEGTRRHVRVSQKMTQIEQAQKTGRRLLWLGIVLLIVLVIAIVLLSAR